MIKLRRHVARLGGALLALAVAPLAAVFARMANAADAGPPATHPTLSAKGRDTQVGLNWSQVLDATSYTVRRATRAGGPYAVIAHAARGATLTDSGLTNGVTYYYVVTADTAAGVGPPSPEDSAMPLPVDGAAPYAGVTLGPSGILYGTTASGGEFGSGVVFRLRPDGAYKTLHHFQALMERAGALGQL